MGAADEAPVADEILVVHRDAVAAGHADRVPVAVDVEQAEVLAELEALERLGRVDDDVKRHLVGLGPSLLAGREEAVRAHLLRVLLLVPVARDGPDFGAEGLGEDDAVVAETSDAHDADLLPGSGSEALERAVHRDTGAEHGCCLCAGERFGNGEHPSGC